MLSIEYANLKIEGHLHISDPESGKIYVNQRNAINPENLSMALALSLANKSTGTMYEMHFGNGGTVIDTQGVITYKGANTNGQNEDLYSPTFYKVIDGDDTTNNTDTTKNFITTEHINGLGYTDLIVNCVINYDEPAVADTTYNLAGASQDVLDNASSYDGAFVFDEIGLKSKGTSLNGGLLLTHVTFHPVQKSLNRLLQVRYTIRIRVA